MAGKCYFFNCHHHHPADELIAACSDCWGQAAEAVKRVSHPSLDIIGSRLF